MAQAARLNLRMQKELKLLLTDPPPGAAFPSLSSEASSSSGTCLSSIDAQIEGPEGSVYEKGVFKLKIQIPDRYPFQPPIVTFVTPIYHPNIDTGGRICLDILNLPPKGAWQPSLNISTILTSIGLLLSEPNPDDGLMHEASREYKYNRQIFDQKARSMTEKYAQVGASKVQNVVQGRQTLPNPNIESAEAEGSDASMMPIQAHFVSHKRLCGISGKLSLESSGSDQKMNDGKLVHEVPTSHLYDREGEIMGVKQESKATFIELDTTHTKLQESRKKLSLELLVSVQKENEGIMIDVMPTSSLLQPQFPLKDSSKSWPLVQPGFSSQQSPSADKDSQPPSNSKATKLEGDLRKPPASRQGTGEDDKKLCFAPQQSASRSHQTSLEARTISHQNEKEHNPNVDDGHGSCLSRNKNKKLGLSGRRLSREQLGWSQRPQKDNKENIAPNSSLPLSHIQKNPTLSSGASDTGGCYNISVQISTISSHNPCGTEQWQTLSPLVKSNDIRNTELQLKMQSEYPSRPPNLQKESCNDKKLQSKDCDERFAAGIKNQDQASSSDDAVIVLDSEDSEEEQGRTTRSRLSLARRRLPGKRKS